MIPKVFFLSFFKFYVENKKEKKKAHLIYAFFFFFFCFTVEYFSTQLQPLSLVKASAVILCGVKIKDVTSQL